MTIYLDHQASTPMLPTVRAAMQPLWTEFHGNPHSSEHSIGWSANKATETSRAKVANLLGVDPDEIIFTSGATEANNLAIKGLSTPEQRQSQRTTILVSATEHKCVLESAAYVAQTKGCAVREIPVNGKGHVDLDKLRDMLSEDVLLVSVALVNNEIGTIQDLASISALCRDMGAILHSDFAQAPSAVNLQEYADMADMVSLSGHKFGGPMGVGALYVSRELKDRIEPLFHGGGQEGGLRSGTLPLPLCVGLGSAAEFHSSEAGSALRARVAGLRDLFVDKLQSNRDHIGLNGDKLCSRHPGNANLRFEGRDAGEMLQRLQPIVSASTGSACSSGISEPSYVLRAIGLTSDEAQASIRFSFGHTNTSDEVLEAAEAIIAVL
ncbi:cysteine desulfurase family protein [Aliiroseovarius sp. F47248L]|uniref:cysteine desulfurase family protein n=1 Tax=Aliiroseovarius sp. F47248L TaxID=2926420 RepID=UPI00248BE9D0|nr:cysteine desulfurase family protein [Aliiroseovarius sp. F47248L]